MTDPACPCGIPWWKLRVRIVKQGDERVRQRRCPNGHRLVTVENPVRWLRKLVRVHKPSGTESPE